MLNYTDLLEADCGVRSLIRLLHGAERWNLPNAKSNRIFEPLAAAREAAAVTADLHTHPVTAWVLYSK